jgi:hypothetical protein
VPGGERAVFRLGRGPTDGCNVSYRVVTVAAVRRLWLSRSPWVDWVAALPLAVIVLNLHVATKGDALSAMERPDRRIAYGAILLAQLGLLLAVVLRRSASAARGVTLTAAVGGAASLAALLFDVQDGPVRTVQLFFLLGLFAACVAVIRLISRPT